MVGEEIEHRTSNTQHRTANGERGRTRRRREDEEEEEDDEDGKKESGSETKRYNPKQSGRALRNKGLEGGTNRETG